MKAYLMAGVGTVRLNALPGVAAGLVATVPPGWPGEVPVTPTGPDGFGLFAPLVFRFDPPCGIELPDIGPPEAAFGVGGERMAPWANTGAVISKIAKAGSSFIMRIVPRAKVACYQTSRPPL